MAVKLTILYLAPLVFTGYGPLQAQPDFTNATRSCGINFYADSRLRNIYYYLPGDIEIGKKNDGSPDISFILMRYAGSYTFHDADKLPQFRNILTMKLLMKNVNADSLKKARNELLHGAPGQLKPIPVSQVEAMVVFTPIAGSDSGRFVEKGTVSVEGDGGYSTSSSYWSERYFTLFPDNNSAIILLDAFNRDLTIISFTYAFYAKGISEKHFLTESGYGNLDNFLQKALQTPGIDSVAADSTKECIMKSDAFAIRIDTSKYPNLIRKIDINDAMPPGYAILNIRDYDFANHLRPDLYEKSIELEATGASGDPVNLNVRFNSKDPDITSVNFRFKYAVRLDKPYRYRVHEILRDGREQVTDWSTINTWSNMLDITSRQQ